MLFSVDTILGCFGQSIVGFQQWFIFRTDVFDEPLSSLNPILDGGGQICPPAGFFNIAQKPLGLGSWNFVTFSFYI